MKEEDPWWNDAYEVTLSCGAVLQMVGLSSPTRTVFGRIDRIVPSSSSPNNTSNDAKEDTTTTTTTSPVSVQNVLEWMLQLLHQVAQKERGQEGQQQALGLPSVTELLQLGAVWKLTARNNSTGKMERTRQFLQNANDALQPIVDSLRVHCFPSRFPAAHLVDWTLPALSGACATITTVMAGKKHKAILFYNVDVGFAIVHKPGGLPSHATVDNGVENVLYQVEQLQQCLALGDFGGRHTTSKPSLPHRLDIETEGLLLVATKPEFSSYIGRMLEQKSLQASSVCWEEASRRRAASAIHKQYRCRIRLNNQEQRWDFLQQLHETPKEGIIEHYMDPGSLAPKTFQTEPRKGWLKCLLRILSVGPVMTFKGQDETVDGDGDGTAVDLVMQVQVELLTGRTHQIRGQLAAMNLPLVGDPLYGGKPNESTTWNARRNRGGTVAQECQRERLGLQCCFLSFPKPMWHIHEKHKRPCLLEHEIEECTFELESAWWSVSLEPL